MPDTREKFGPRFLYGSKPLLNSIIIEMGYVYVTKNSLNFYLYQPMRKRIHLNTDFINLIQFLSQVSWLESWVELMCKYTTSMKSAPIFANKGVNFGYMSTINSINRSYLLSQLNQHKNWWLNLWYKWSNIILIEISLTILPSIQTLTLLQVFWSGK